MSTLIFRAGYTNYHFHITKILSSKLNLFFTFLKIASPFIIFYVRTHTSHFYCSIKCTHRHYHNIIFSCFLTLKNWCKLIRFNISILSLSLSSQLTLHFFPFTEHDHLERMIHSYNKYISIISPPQVIFMWQVLLFLGMLPCLLFFFSIACPTKLFQKPEDTKKCNL